MGLLSDLSLSPRNKIGRSLAKHSGKFCLVLYSAGLIWFFILAHPNLNHHTYLSENALSPGLVNPEMKQDSSRLAASLLEELERERVQYKSSTPHAWILAKMKQIGLETHVHNFTLRYPFAGGKEYHGKNIYGIVRAPRVGSTEGIVFSAPYRPPSSVHTEITASVPMLLAFAEFARKKNYWAKDLIFLVTEQEQLGMHAWLEAYYKGGIEDSSILNCGNLPARAGALQAALNLEIQDLDTDYIDVKIEGLNGQLPNLDMFNLVQRITSREGISSGYKQNRKKIRSLRNSIEDNFKHILQMIISQANGVPTGNHGLYHRYRIESLTLEAVKPARINTNSNHRNTISIRLLKTIEGISRSLNNLLERFHQSYFFYILIKNERFISIGDFMPCLILLASPMFIKSFLLWLTSNNENNDNENQETSAKKSENVTESGVQLPYTFVILYICVVSCIGLLCSTLPLNDHLRNNFVAMGVSTEATITSTLAALSLISFSLPFFVTLPKGGLTLLHIAVLLFHGVALIVVGLLNFALGFLLATFTVPLVMAITTDGKKNIFRTIKLFYAILVNPLAAVYFVVLILTLFQFPELAWKSILMRALNATMDAITFALMDCMIYGNWLFTAVTAVFFPIWTLCWTLVLSREKRVKHSKQD